MEAVGARGQGSLACSLVGLIPLFPTLSVTSSLHLSFSLNFPETGNKCPEFWALQPLLLPVNRLTMDHTWEE